MDTEEFLAHHGIKGMHWGVRRASAPRSVDQIQKSINKFEKKRGTHVPGSLVIAGAGATAGTAKKKLKLKEIKDSNGAKRLIETDKTPKSTKENRDAFNKKIDRATYAKYISTGTLVVGALLGTAVLAKSINDPGVSDLVTKGALVLAGAQTIHTTGIVSGVHANAKLRGQQQKSSALEQELRDAKKREG
jgi:hypothetical protein